MQIIRRLKHIFKMYLDVTVLQTKHSYPDATHLYRPRPDQKDHKIKTTVGVLRCTKVCSLSRGALVTCNPSSVSLLWLKILMGT